MSNTLIPLNPGCRSHPPHAEGAHHVGPPPVCRELDLRLRMATPNQRVNDGQAEMPRQFASLVEPADVAGASEVGPVRNAIRLIEKLRPMGTHQRREGPCEGSPTVVLERVNDVPERAVIFANRPRAADESILHVGTTAPQNRSRQRFTAPVARRAE